MIYAATRLIKREPKVLKYAKDIVDFQCGSLVIGVNSPEEDLNQLGERVYTNKTLDCWMPIEMPYYSSKNLSHFPRDICCWCATKISEEGKKQLELRLKEFATVLPVCDSKNCQHKPLVKRGTASVRDAALKRKAETKAQNAQQRAAREDMRRSQKRKASVKRTRSKAKRPVKRRQKATKKRSRSSSAAPKKSRKSLSK